MSNVACHVENVNHCLASNHSRVSTGRVNIIISLQSKRPRRFSSRCADHDLPKVTFQWELCRTLTIRVVKMHDKSVLWIRWILVSREMIKVGLCKVLWVTLQCLTYQSCRVVVCVLQKFLNNSKLYYVKTLANGISSKTKVHFLLGSRPWNRQLLQF